MYLGIADRYKPQLHTALRWRQKSSGEEGLLCPVLGTPSLPSSLRWPCRNSKRCLYMSLSWLVRFSSICRRLISVCSCLLVASSSCRWTSLLLRQFCAYPLFFRVLRFCLRRTTSSLGRPWRRLLSSRTDRWVSISSLIRSGSPPSWWCILGDPMLLLTLIGRMHISSSW